jgi:hypothetical protein
MRLNRNMARRLVAARCRKMIGSSKNQSAGQDTEWRDGFDAEFTSAVWCVERPSDEETALMQAAGAAAI